uniref:Uncharacterized protein n=1 Tax=Octopus bimaculoides TaxID=37653 RepID=A0A0L8G2I1_OCTBM
MCDSVAVGADNTNRTAVTFIASGQVLCTIDMVLSGKVKSFSEAHQILRVTSKEYCVPVPTNYVR